MRDYVYIWDDADHTRLVASGIEFRDVIPDLASTSGLFLLDHNGPSTWPKDSPFTLLPASRIPELEREDIYSWGNFIWVDYTSDEIPTLSKHTIAELLYFAHTSRPFDSIHYPELKNRFLYTGHDDGWALHLYYSDNTYTAPLLKRIEQRFGVAAGADLQGAISSDAVWITADTVQIAPRSLDIDSIQGRFWKPSPNQ